MPDPSLYRRSLDFVNTLWAWLKPELGVLVTLTLVCVGVWGFAEIAQIATTGASQSFDERVLLMMRSGDDLSDPIGPHWLEEMGRDFTALGGVAVITLLSLLTVAYLLLYGKKRAALFVTAAIGGGILMSSVLKNVFDRARPDLVPHGSIVYSASFPSGHSMMAAVTYLTLAALLARVQASTREKVFILVSAILLTMGVGISRVYMGVHWPTDVLAGWAGGAAWALLCWTVALWLQRRGQLEDNQQDDVDPKLATGG